MSGSTTVGSSGSGPSFEEIVSGYRRHIKDTAAAILKLKKDVAIRPAADWPAVADIGEVLANITLCYRHLEDAAMRLGKVIQAHDGGVSVYDK